MIDNGMMPEAKDILESLNETDVYNENEQGVLNIGRWQLGHCAEARGLECL